MFWVSVKYVKGECLSLVLQKLNMGDHCEVFSSLKGSVLEISHVEEVSTAIDSLNMDGAPSPMTSTPCKVKSTALKPNISTAQDVRPKPVITCTAPACNYRTTWLTNMKKHQRVHTGKMFPCKECDKAYSSKQRLKDHHRSKHQNNTLMCEVCGRSLESSNGLQNHRKVEHEKKHVVHGCSHYLRQ